MYNTDTHTLCTLCLCLCLCLSLSLSLTHTHTQIKCWGSICSQSRGRKLYLHWWIRTDQGRRKCEGHFSWKEKQEQRLSGLCNYKLFPVARTKNWATNTFTFMGFLAAQLVKNLPAMQENSVQFLCWEVPLEREWVPIPVFLGFPGASHSEESTCNAGDLDSIPGLGRSLRGRHPGLPREEHRSFPAPLPLSPFYPPDLDRRVDSTALSGRGSWPPAPPLSHRVHLY